MLSKVTEGGHAVWTCPSCANEHIEHVSHPQMEWVPQEHVESFKARLRAYDVPEEEVEARARQNLAFHNTLALPPCACGTRTFLKVDYSDEELRASNMLDGNGEPTESHRAAHRHMALARHMTVVGKSRVGQLES